MNRNQPCDCQNTIAFIKPAPLLTPIAKLMVGYTAASQRISEIGGSLEEEVASATVWTEMSEIVEWMTVSPSSTLDDVALKLKVTLDLMDEQDPTRKILQSAADDFMAIVAAGGPQSRLA